MTRDALALTQSTPRQAGIKAAWLTVMTLALIMAQTLVAKAQAAPPSFADLADQISPSVVNITTSTVVAGRTDNAPRGIVPEGAPFVKAPLRGAALRSRRPCARREARRRAASRGVRPRA